ncbi:MAG TPA: hypothetical protein VMS88_04905 [Terriglobales bacterium]|nr:hypothetical protein [Terriglobales bacterium]
MRRAGRADTRSLLVVPVLALGVFAADLAGAAEPDARLSGTALAGGMGWEASSGSRVLEAGPLGLWVMAATRAAGPNGDHLRPAQLLAGERLEIGGARRGAWLGLAQQRAWEDARISAYPAVTAGAWARMHGFVVTTDVERRTARIPQTPLWITSWPPALQGLPGNWPPDFSHWSDVLPFFMPRDPEQVHVTAIVTSIRWSRGRLDLEGSGGVVTAVGTGPYRLARGEAAWWLRPHLALTAAAAGATPAWLGIDLVSRPHVQLGLRIEPGRAAAPPPARTTEAKAGAWRVRDRGGGLYSLGLWAPAARTVELRGDVTGWNPVSLQSAADGWWEATLPLAPGLHGVEIRIDGGRWQPPPGLPAAPGEYGARAGVIVIP